MFRAAVSGLGLAGGLVWDGMAMASELAASTLHARGNVQYDDAGDWPLAGAPEMWVYLRRAAGRWELVCKVFDSLGGGGGDGGGPALRGHAGQVVAGLSDGRCGHHLTRARLGGWKIPGRAVWFALPVPPACVPAALQPVTMPPRKAARALHALLTSRGLGSGLLWAEEPSAGMSVLSVRRGLTVWCRDRVIWWRGRDGRYQRRVPTDLVDISEQLVTSCAEMDAEAQAPLAAGQRAGCMPQGGH